MIKPKMSDILFDEKLLMEKVKVICTEEISKVKDKIVEIMKAEVDKTHAGKPKWREDLKNNIDLKKIVERSGIVEFVIGAVADGGYPDGDYFKFVRWMAVTCGVGVHGLYGEPVTAGPHGRSVFDDELEGKHPSEAKSTYEIDSFSQVGHDWVANASKRVKVIFDAAARAAWQRVDTKLILSCIKVTKPR